MNTLVIDAYDSFVYIIYQYLLSADANPTVVRNDKISLAQIEKMQPDWIVLGPGPGHPKDAHYIEIIKRFGAKIPIMGICLGHQAIGLAFGGEVTQAKHIMHGKVSQIEHDSRGCFLNQAQPFRATRYHSLIVDQHNLPDCLEVSAHDCEDHYIMGLRHKTMPIESLQFHPESVYTEEGMQLFTNYIQRYLSKITCTN